MSRELGRGSYSAVYAVDDNTAIKCFVRGNLDDGQWHTTMVSAVREIFICSQINHPNVIHFDKVSLVMREIKMPRYDMDMFTWLTQCKPTPQAARGIMAQIACGLAAIHSADIIHADLKLQNVLIKLIGGPAPQAVICDFGVSLYTTSKSHPRLVQSGEWRAPEVRGAARDPVKFTQKIDMWSYGVMFAQSVFKIGAPSKLIADYCHALRKSYVNLTPDDINVALFGQRTRPQMSKEEYIVCRCLLANARPTSGSIAAELTGRAPPQRMPIVRVSDGVILQYVATDLVECVPIAESIFIQLPPGQRTAQTAAAALYIAGAVHGEKRITRTPLPPLNILDSILSRNYA